MRKNERYASLETTSEWFKEIEDMRKRADLAESALISAQDGFFARENLLKEEISKLQKECELLGSAMDRIRVDFSHELSASIGWRDEDIANLKEKNAFLALENQRLPCLARLEEYAALNEENNRTKTEIKGILDNISNPVIVREGGGLPDQIASLVVSVSKMDRRIIELMSEARVWNLRVDSLLAALNKCADWFAGRRKSSYSDMLDLIKAAVEDKPNTNPLQKLPKKIGE